MTAHSFTSSLALPDGRSIYVSIEIPAEHPSVQDPSDISDHTEYAQMAASHALRGLVSGDHHRARRQAKEIDEMNAELVAKLDGKVPF